MAYTAPGTAVAGDVLTASFWNQQVRDNMEAVAGAPFARNIIYNGAMQVAQRGTSTASITTAGYYTADRWLAFVNTLGTWTQSVENDAPTGSGLRKSLKMLCTTADASPAAGDYLILRQLLEGQDVQRIAKGTSSAQTLTISFWIKSNVTGTFIVELEDEDNARTVSQSYTISATATWERKTITFAADTTGAFDNDNAASLILNFWLASGSSFNSGTLQTSWGTRTNANRNVGGSNLANAINNYWQVTGVQLEVGSAATGFEFLPYGDELRRCQRYFERITSPDADGNFAVGVMYTATSFLGTIFFGTKRATPTLSAWTTGAGAYEVVTNGTVYSSSASGFNYASATLSTSQVSLTIPTAVANLAGVMRNGTTSGGYIDISAEL